MAITTRKVTFEFDVTEYLSNVPRSERADAKERIAQYLFDQIVNDTQRGISPVTGGKFKKLSKEYKKAKQSQGGSGKPDLDLTGSMLGSLEYKIKGNKIEIGIFDSGEAPKAYNHNIGDTLPQRQFIPDEEQNFRKGILQAIPNLIDE